MKIYNTDGRLITDVKDALVELCNAGTGMVSITIGNILNIRISIDTPKITSSDTESDNLNNLLDDKDAVAIFMHMTDTIQGEVAFIIHSDLLVSAVEALTGEKYTFERMMEDDCGFSAVQEFGNIIGSAYVKAIGQYTGIRFYLSPVMVGVDKASRLIHTAYTRLPAGNARQIRAESKFTVVDADDQPVGHAGYIVMIPDEDSVEKLMDAIGI